MIDGLTLDVAGRAVAAALLHSVWQGALIAALAALALRVLRGASAQSRYVVACAGLTAMLGGFAITAARSAADVEGGRQTALNAPPTPTAPPLGPGPLDFSSAIRELRPSDLTENARLPSWPVRLQRWSAAAVPLWFAGVVLLSVRVSVGWLVLARLRRTRLAPVASDLRARITELARRVRVSRPVRVAQSAAVHVPSVVGWLHPVILVPASALSGLSPAQLDAVLAHELAHIRRHDFAVNALQTAADVLLFYHPACWWLSRRIRVEREHCCDDIAVAVCGDRLAYAAALADLEALRQRPALALAATDGPLLSRVRRLVTPPERDGSPAWAALALPLAVVAIAIGGVVVTRAQAPEQVRVPGMGRTIPGDRGIVQGQVVEAGTGRPIAGARVEVRGSSDAGVRHHRPGWALRDSTSDTGGLCRIGHRTRPRACLLRWACRLDDRPDHTSRSRLPLRALGRLATNHDGRNVAVRTSVAVDVRPGFLVSDIDVAMQATGAVERAHHRRWWPGAGWRLHRDRARPPYPPAHHPARFPASRIAQSDSDGAYRVTAPPGDYTVRAYIGRHVRPSREAARAYVATFYPGVRSQEAAQLIRVNAGAEQYDVDFALLSSRTVRVSGTVVDPARGHDLEGVSVSLRGVPSVSGETIVSARPERPRRVRHARRAAGNLLRDGDRPALAVAMERREAADRDHRRRHATWISAPALPRRSPGGSCAIPQHHELI